jgi:hypothetical protein
MTYSLENLLPQTRRRCRSTLRAAGWAQPPPLARKRYQDIAPAAVAMEPREAVLEDPTVQIPSHRPVHHPAPEAVAILESIFPRLLDRLVAALQKTIKRCPLRLPRVPQRGATLGPGEIGRH